MNTDAAPLLGAEVVEGGTCFRLFADCARLCQVRLLDDTGAEQAVHDLPRQSDGYHEITVAGAGHGTLYLFLLDGQAFPDPYARFLPRGVDGPAMVVESKYTWRNGDGVSRPMGEQVVYELHVGTFTPEGTYRAARGRLQALQDLGVTSVELMPLSSFAGRRGWGYDGVAHFAPHPEYGTPDELRQFIDDAHGMDLSVLLDVVYNHFGPAGNYLRPISNTGPRVRDRRREAALTRGYGLSAPAGRAPCPAPMRGGGAAGAALHERWPRTRFVEDASAARVCGTRSRARRRRQRLRRR
ncbi:MAG: alpha-amylase family glycosyl hydrolase, partial [Polyangia bacterium]